MKTTFTQIYEQYRDWLWIVALEYLNDEFEAKDVVQDVFVKLWKKDNLHEFNSKAHLKGHLYLTVKNACINILDKRKVKERKLSKFLLIKEYKTEYYNKFENIELNEKLEKAIYALPPIRQTVFILKYLLGKSHNEISHLLDITVESTRKHIKLALKDLRSDLKTTL